MDLLKRIGDKLPENAPILDLCLHRRGRDADLLGDRIRIVDMGAGSIGTDRHVADSVNKFTQDPAKLCCVRT